MLEGYFYLWAGLSVLVIFLELWGKRNWLDAVKDSVMMGIALGLAYLLFAK